MEAAVAIIAAITALCAVILGPLVSIWTAQVQARVAVLSTNRQAWIDSLRELIAEYFAIANYVHASDWAERALAEHHERMGRLSYLNAKIRLMLNPEEEDHKGLLVALGELALLCSNAPKVRNKDLWHRHHNDAMTLSQKILKREWERVKRVK